MTNNDWCPENDITRQMEQSEIRALSAIEENREIKIQRDLLKSAIEECLEYANGREHEWGNRAIGAFNILHEALAQLEGK